VSGVPADWNKEYSMPHFKHLIVGAGMTGDAAVKGIREVDPNGLVGLIGDEPDLPYDRPPLSKALWKGAPLESVWRTTEAQGVELLLGRRIVSLDATARRATDDRGVGYTFDKLLLATGGAPRRLPFGGDHIVYFRTVADYRRLRSLAEGGRHFAVIGGGFIGAEIAAGLAINAKEVTVAFPEEALGSRVFPRELGLSLNRYYEEKGVRILAKHGVVGVTPRGERLAVEVRPIDGGAAHEVLVDGVVAGIGIQPNVELARAAGLGVDDGILVDELLRTSHPDILAAGDVASFFSPALGMRVRVEHEDNANSMGRAAGRAMAGAAEPYHHLPFFYSDLFELGYEAVGQIDARLEVVADWRTPNREGVVYYLQDGRVRGVLLLNVWEQVDAARRLISEPGPFRAVDLKGRLPAP
jgi:NADPH-dependent 2,4-dienoyl-CoA reductase/sulfur reductase-like enzyme